MIVTLRGTPDPALPFLLAMTNHDRRTPSFPTLPALARAIHRRRANRPIMVVDAEIECGTELQPRTVAAIHALNDEQQPVEFLGFAWMKGRDARTLQQALRTAEGR